MRAPSFLALVACLVAAGAAPPTPCVRLVTARLTFEEAARPYLGQRYEYSGYVGPDGKVKGGGLGCSAFTSVVLHRMRDGEAWRQRYDLRVHQWYGERAAEHFGLARAGKFASKELLSAERVRALTEAGTLREGQLYYFNARRGQQGHVGFVRVLPGGKLEQAHYSSIKGGLYRGNFRAWLKASLYRGATVELYGVPEPR